MYKNGDRDIRHPERNSNKKLLEKEKRLPRKLQVEKKNRKKMKGIMGKILSMKIQSQMKEEVKDFRSRRQM